jgi:acyl-CoA synthetase (AMP-forming)/AMP-acid ligase II
MDDAPAPDLEYTLLLSSGSAAPEALKRRVMDVFGPCLGETYGLTEGVGTFAPPAEVRRHRETVGRPITGTELVIITEDGQRAPVGEIGEIAGRSPAMMTGYHQRESDTEALAWRDPETGHRFMRTGDIGRIDAAGRLSVLDRKKDMIVTGGLNIFAADIEAAFRALPEVTDVAVVAKPDPKWGETPYAFVRVRDGAPAIETLLEHANAQLAKTQRVRDGAILSEDFPRNALGKVLKRELRDRLS